MMEEKTYQCPNCGDCDYDALSSDNDCKVCCKIENNVEKCDLTIEND